MSGLNVGGMLLQGTVFSALTGQTEGNNNIWLLVVLGMLYRIFVFFQSQEQNVCDLIPYWMHGSLVMNKLEYTGSIVTTHGFWNHNTTAITSDEFNALLAHLRDNCQKQARSFSQLTLHDIDSNASEGQKNSSTLYVCNSRVPFPIAPGITCSVCVQTEQEEKSSVKTKKISVSLMSSTKDAKELMSFVDDLTTAYLANCRRAKHDKLYIYRLRTRSGDDGGAYWHEVHFKSTRTFNNIYFPGKKELLEKLAFFRDNEEWYKEHGLPWTLGIGLHGRPGTGKTSFVKALTNYFRRHVIELPLSVINGEEQFFEAYFETGYDRKDKADLDWVDKIVAFEDVDAQSELVRRDKKVDVPWVPIKDKDGQIILQAPEKPQQPLSLACILNTIDGIRENHGRIMVLSSNHYGELDPALTRAGRIDIEISMGNADIDILDEIHEEHFGKKLSARWREHFGGAFEMPPCDIINYLKGGVTSEEFMDEVAEQHKILKGLPTRPPPPPPPSPGKTPLTTPPPRRSRLLHLCS